MKTLFYFRGLNILLLILVSVLLFKVSPALATLDIGLNTVSDSISLAQTDPIIIAVKIINISSLFLAIITVIIILYGGAQYLFASGDDELITKARKTIIRGLIGLVIVLASWTIASSVVGKFVVDTGASLSDEDYLAVVDTGIVTDNGTGILPCVPNCENNECGDDGCGNSCGSCDYDKFCNDSNVCEIYLACASSVESYIADPTPSNFVCGVSTVRYEGGPWDSTGTTRNKGGYYRTVQIGDQCWLRDNMNIGTRVNSCANGACVGDDCEKSCFDWLSPFDIASDSVGNIEKYCYADLESNCDLYGGLYNWPQLMQLPWACFNGIWNGSNCDTNCNASSLPNNQDRRRGICPAGWHVPNNLEQHNLVGTYSNCDEFDSGGNHCSPAGGALKIAADCYVPGSSYCGATGMDILLGGGRAHGGQYGLWGTTIGNGWYWNATQISGSAAWARDTSLGYDAWFVNNESKLWSFAVRCIKD